MTFFRNSPPEAVGWCAQHGGFRQLCGSAAAIAMVAASIPLFSLSGCRPKGVSEQGVASEEESSQIGHANIHPGSGNFLLEYRLLRLAGFVLPWPAYRCAFLLIAQLYAGNSCAINRWRNKSRVLLRDFRFF